MYCINQQGDYIPHVNQNTIPCRYILQTYVRPDIVFTHAEGARMYDANGKEYLDFAAGIAVNSVGTTLLMCAAQLQITQMISSAVHPIALGIMLIICRSQPSQVVASCQRASGNTDTYVKSVPHRSRGKNNSCNKCCVCKLSPKPSLITGIVTLALVTPKVLCSCMHVISHCIHAQCTAAACCTTPCDHPGPALN